jgi:hypothetical protein
VFRQQCGQEGIDSPMTLTLLPSKVRYLVPARTSTELCLSAWRGCLSLLSESKSRDQYWDYRKDGILRDDSSSSLLMGQVRMASLWDELEHSKQYGFQPYEFLEGVTPALGQFHDMQRKLDQLIFQILHGTTDLETNHDCANTTPLGNDKTSVDPSKDKNDVVTICEEDFQQMLRELEDFSVMEKLNNPDSQLKSKLNSIYQWDWNDTIVQDFHRIVSPEFFKSYQLEGIVRTIMMGSNPIDVIKKTEVDNCMILSARIKFLEDSKTKKNNDNTTFNEDELDMTIQADEKLTVAIRVDVLYDMYRTVSIPQHDKVKDENNSNIDPIEFVYGDRCHGVFEGFLNSNNENPLRWRISNIDRLHTIRA